MPDPRVSDRPTPGHYLLRLVRKGPWVAAEIRFEYGLWLVMIDGTWHGPSADPWALPAMEQVHWGGRPAEPSETAYRLALARFAREHSPDAPAANPRRAINPDAFIPF